MQTHKKKPKKIKTEHKLKPTGPSMSVGTDHIRLSALFTMHTCGTQYSKQFWKSSL